MADEKIHESMGLSGNIIVVPRANQEEADRVAERTVNLLRELEALLSGVQINVEGGTLPYAGINCARQILAEIFLSVGLRIDPELPAIHVDNIEAVLEG